VNKGHGVTQPDTTQLPEPGVVDDLHLIGPIAG
jgi:hypothetical protein